MNTLNIWNTLISHNGVQGLNNGKHLAFGQVIEHPRQKQCGADDLQATQKATILDDQPQPSHYLDPL